MECVGEYAGEYERVEIKNLCITCKRDMGPDNLRQLCGKYQCDYEDEMEADFEDIPNKTISNEEKTNEEIATEFWEFQKKYYEENRDIILNRVKQYREDHYEEVLQKKAAYREQHRAELCEKQKEYAAEHKEEYKQSRKKYKRMEANSTHC